ncbi:MAG TPA: hypothetical protein VJU14_10895 [Solirubrobacterales bacterium]|nr:hypothetical protein [Solirubrobacterales bacterium]
MAPARSEGGKLTPTGTIGLVGCSVGDRVVRIGVVEGLDKGPRVVNLDPCPACGNPHPKVLPAWRHPTPRDEGREVEVVVDAEGEVVP